MFLPRQQHLQKTRAVDKWLDNEPVTDEEMKWIEKIKKRWTEDKDNLPGFAEFKAALDDILGIMPIDALLCLCYVMFIRCRGQCPAVSAAARTAAALERGLKEVEMFILLLQTVIPMILHPTVGLSQHQKLLLNNGVARRVSHVAVGHNKSCVCGTRRKAIEHPTYHE